ncbi:MAG TPA: response regulator transcription factor, partial [Campylobacteraceae bacterium]|nr:response regulator transcription factor [Campylobacteraceae bacterium]
MTEIMMIEDDLQITELLRRFLERFGMRVNGFAAPADALRSLRIDHYDLIILDLSLPQMDGLEVCKTIRASYTTPIIISSARSDLADKVAALELGADDYLPKPYEPRELVARIQTVLRRYRKTLQPSAGSEPFFVDEQKMPILKEGRQLELTLAEYEILRLLILKRGTVVSR